MRFGILFAVIAGFVGVFVCSIPAFAQGTLDGVGQDGISLNSTETGVPLLEKISEKGIYLVQLRWAQVTLNPNNELDLQIFFLNATASRETNRTVGAPGTNTTKSGTETGEVVTNATESLLPIASYDISIYSSEGGLLWQKLEQPGHGGMPGQRVLFEGNYTGPVTIEIANIKPGWGADDAREELTDSVTFSATVVPEFPPLAVLPLAAAIAVAIGFKRQK
jgi:hypothetical protein